MNSQSIGGLWPWSQWYWSMALYQNLCTQLQFSLNPRCSMRSNIPTNLFLPSGCGKCLFHPSPLPDFFLLLFYHISRKKENFARRRETEASLYLLYNFSTVSRAVSTATSVVSSFLFLILEVKIDLHRLWIKVTVVNLPVPAGWLTDDNFHEARMVFLTR